MECSLHPLAENAIIIDLGGSIEEAALKKLRTITAYLDKNPFPWLTEYVPAFTTVTIYYDPLKVLEIQPGIQLPYDFVSQQLSSHLKDLKTDKMSPQRVVSIPVCYGGYFGPDLKYVAHYNNMSVQEVIEIHSANEYIVYMIGFSPGFPYLGGMSERISAPRRSSPRLKIPPGSVGIAGKQTGIYPIETPGGWQIIGRTPKNLFQPDEELPSLLQAGDKIKFTPISNPEFMKWEEQKNDNHS